MAALKEKATEVMRNGWLAYIGMYGVAYDRIKPLVTEKASETFGEFVSKGEKVESDAQNLLGDVGKRAATFYANSFDNVRELFQPTAVGGAKFDALLSQVEQLNAKVDALSGQAPAAKRRPPAKAS